MLDGHSKYFLDKLKTLPYSRERLLERLPIPDNVRSIHIAGICGTAMGMLAGLLLEAGYQVTGSDEKCYPPVSDLLASLEIKVQSFSVENLKGVDVIVIGNVCPPENIEASFARENNIPYVSLPEALREFCFKDRKVIAVAGTHGKTTTTAMTIHIMQELGLDPGYLVGGVLSGNPSSYSLGSGEYFIVEGDEYDSAYFDKSPKFLNYKPFSAIITSIEHDHFDIYPNKEEYHRVFDFLAESLPDKGLMIANESCADLRDLHRNTFVYGQSEEADIRYVLLGAEKDGEKYKVFFERIEVEGVVPMFGSYNVANAVASIVLVSKTCSVEVSDCVRALASFKGIKRRQSIRVETSSMILLDDFAHHPTAVKKTLEGIKRRFPGRRVVAIFEPRSVTSRRNIFEKPYSDSLKAADMVFISTPPVRPGDNIEEFVNPENIVSEVSSVGVSAFAFNDYELLTSSVKKLLKEGDVVVTMTNGSFGSVRESLEDHIRSLDD